MFKNGDILKHKIHEEHLLVIGDEGEGYVLALLGEKQRTMHFNKVWIDAAYEKVA